MKGFKLNWRSYDRPQQRVQPEAQYSEASVIPHTLPQRQRGHVHPQPQPHPQPQLQAQAAPQILNFDTAPAYIKDRSTSVSQQLPDTRQVILPN